MDDSMALVIEVTDEDFEAQTKREGWCLVDFYATWCPHCKQFRPQYEAAAAAHDGPVRFLAADSDRSPQAANSFGIMGLPTVVLFRDGARVDSHAGAMEAPELAAWLGQHVEA